MIMLDYCVNDSIPLIVSDHRMGGRMAAEEFRNSGCHYVLHLCNKETASNVVSYESHMELDRRLTE